MSLTAAASTTSFVERARKWQRNVWKVDSVIDIISASADTVTLIANDDLGRKREVTVHTDLLCYYSKYYRAAIKGGFAEAKKRVFEVDTDPDILRLFVGWLYTGQISEALGPKWSDACTRLYIFADVSDILALRRAVIHTLFSADPLDRFNYESIIRAYDMLPESSQLLRLLEESYIRHWDEHVAEVWGCFEDQWVLVPPPKLPARLVQKVTEERTKRPEEFRDPTPICFCCSKPCELHEHESDEEQAATCGGWFLDVNGRCHLPESEVDW